MDKWDGTNASVCRKCRGRGMIELPPIELLRGVCYEEEGERNARETRFRDTVARINFPSGAQLLSESFWQTANIYDLSRDRSLSNRDNGGGPISCRNVFKIQRSNAIFFLTLIRSNLLISSPQREYFAVEIFFAGSPFPRNSTRYTRRFFPAMLLLIYDSAYYSQLRTQACRVIARRVTRRMHSMDVASNVG